MSPDPTKTYLTHHLELAGRSDTLFFQELADGPRRRQQGPARGPWLPSERPYDVEAVMRDVSSNWLGLVEPPSGVDEA
jgi:hypothetical protein